MATQIKEIKAQRTGTVGEGMNDDGGVKRRCGAWGQSPGCPRQLFSDTSGRRESLRRGISSITVGCYKFVGGRAPMASSGCVMSATGVWVWLLAAATAAAAAPAATPPPLPLLPIPTHAQLKWQAREIILFLHFGMNTFTDLEWGTGDESPSVFSPEGLSTDQWVEVAAECGFSLLILTAKHHDGFCLWPSAYTHHSVKSSPWRDGGGDVVGDFAKSATARGIDGGLYLSPWDRHERSYGDETAYNEFYLGQLRELLTRYGSVQEVWFDGAKAANATGMTYYFSAWFAMARELQGSVNIFSDAGPDVRWVGNEKGYAGETSWSAINRTSLRIGDGSIAGYLNTGDPSGTDWVPAECDVSIRKGWFWHASQKPKPLRRLLDVYYKSVGRNCVLLLNVPPNTTGLVSSADVDRLREFRAAIDGVFSVNLAAGCDATSSSQRGNGGDFGAKNVIDDDHLWSYWAPDGNDADHPWIELHSRRTEMFRFNVVRIQEAIGMGQRIKRYQVFVDGNLVADGTTVGYKRLHRLPALTHGQRVKMTILQSKGLPLISSMGLHYDPFWASTPTVSVSP